MKHTLNDPNEPPLWRDPTRIADLAVAEAHRREENFERAGLLYMLSEILTALHRQAEGIESINENISGLRIELPLRLQGK